MIEFWIKPLSRGNYTRFTYSSNLKPNKIYDWSLDRRNYPAGEYRINVIATAKGNIRLESDRYADGEELVIELE